MTLIMKILVPLLFCCVAGVLFAQETETPPVPAATSTSAITPSVSGRYVLYGNPLSPALAIAEIEVWSNGQNVLAGSPEKLTQDYLYKFYRGSTQELVDGNKDPNERHCELQGEGVSGYQDTAQSYPAIEADLGAMMPVEQIKIYRSLYQKAAHKDGGKDGGWRYLLVLDDARKIVAWKTFNVNDEKWKKENKGIETFVPTPATGAPAGMVVPLKSRSWLSEAEFLRDFLGKPVIDNTQDLSDEQRARLEAFDRRNTPEEINRLGEKFFRVVNLDRPGLAKVKALVERKDYAAALEAFKEPFFQTISGLNTAFEYSWGYNSDSRDTMRARDLASQIFADTKKQEITKFMPGLLPPGKFEFPFQTRPLLAAYSGTGDPKLLALWEQMTDDWALGFQDAADKNPLALRDHFVLIGGPVRSNLLDLANAGRDNPEFIKKLSGATLARFLLPVVEETPVSMWRVWRKCVFNHNFNSISGAWDISKLLADFYAGSRLEQEFKQAVFRLYTLAQYRDGFMVELSDEGHFQFNYLGPSLLYGQMADEQPAWFTPEFECFFYDSLRQAELSAVRHTSPSGLGNRWDWKAVLSISGFLERFPFDKINPADRPAGHDTVSSIAGFLQRLSVMQESEPRAVIDTVYGWGKLLDGASGGTKYGVREVEARLHYPPKVVSDWMPYAGAYYFRGGWDRTDSHLHMLSPALRLAIEEGYYPILKCYDQFKHTSYRFQDYATPLVSVLAAEVDGQRSNPNDGFFFSGSKQSIFTQAVEKPQRRRWYTDEVFDFGEAAITANYQNVYRWREKNPTTNEYEIRYDPDQVKVSGVTATRQIFQIRPARMYVHIERIKYANEDEEHENRIPAKFILSEPAPEMKQAFSDKQFILDTEKKTIKTRNPGNPGVTMAWFGQPEMTFKQYSINSSTSEFWPHPLDEKVNPGVDKQLIDNGWGQGFQNLNGLRKVSGRGLFATWKATGASVVVGALYANAPGKEPVRAFEDLSSDTVAGFRAEAEKGVVVTVLMARTIPADLTAGVVSLQGEALVMVEEPKKPTMLMALGAKQLSVAGKSLSLTQPDFKGALTEGTLNNVQPVLMPLDPPTMGPEINTFVDKTLVTLSTISPDTEIRYTTDVPASRLTKFKEMAQKVKDGRIGAAEASEILAIREDDSADWKVYTEPFEITADTFVRARTFRKGVRDVRPFVTAGTDVSLISYGFFQKKELWPAVTESPLNLQSGLCYDYFEDRWFALWTYADLLPAKKSGTTERLLDVSMRQTDEPFAVSYHGYINIPSDGVYTFYGPDEYINNICEPGYDLRIYIDGEEWNLTQTWHARGTWSVPLANGLHAFKLTFADARAKDLERQKPGLWSDYANASTTWRGIVPTLEVSGPGLQRSAIDNTWFKRTK